MHQPVSYRVKVDEFAQPSAIRLDENGCIVLSERDVDRIAAAVARLLNPKPVTTPPTSPEPDYFPVKKNQPRIPTSEY